MPSLAALSLSVRTTAAIWMYVRVRSETGLKSVHRAHSTESAQKADPRYVSMWSLLPTAKITMVSAARDVSEP